MMQPIWIMKKSVPIYTGKIFPAAETATVIPILIQTQIYKNIYKTNQPTGGAYAKNNNIQNHLIPRSRGG